MKKMSFFGILLAAVIGVSMVVGTVYAETPSEVLLELGRNVYISDVTYDPAVFFTGDTGTATFQITNGNTGDSITVNHASFGDQDIKLTSGTYDSSSTIGPSMMRDYTFSVIANSDDGIYYPPFSLSFYGANSLWEREPVKIDNTRLIVLVIDKPDAFTSGGKDTITVQISNPRDSVVKNVIIYVDGEGVEITSPVIFIGKLEAGESTMVDISVTPSQETELAIAVDYNNGDNVHGVSTSLPIIFSPDKKQASTVVTNIDVGMLGGVYYVKGDVTNSGLETANGVMITSLYPAVPEDPYQNYVIGALKPDDFGSFELTFDAKNVTSVPLELSYKDEDGNVITSEYEVSLSKVIEQDIRPAVSTSLFPLVGLAVAVFILVGGYIFLQKRKNQQG